MQVQGTLQLPGDKSISHRAIMLSAIAEGVSYVRNLNDGADLQSTINILRDCGASIEDKENKIVINGKELHSPSKQLDCGNSGTTTRLIAGLLSSQKLIFSLIGDESLSKRPMKRIITPLTAMGCKISSNNGLLPLSIDASSGISAIDYDMKVASAQVKSSILFSALGGNNITSINEIIPTRNHSEVMLKNMGASIETQGDKIIVHPLKSKLKSIDISVPSDPSSSAFFAGLAVITNNSKLKLTHLVQDSSKTHKDRFYTSRMSAYEVVQMAITGELCNPGFRYCTQWCIIYQCIIFYSLFMQNMSIGAILDCFL